MQDFQNPSNRYRIFPIMHSLAETDDPKALSAQADRVIAGAGAGGAVTNVRWTPAWVTDPKNLACLEAAAGVVREKGCGVWVYDEYWYPSGWANGYAIRNHPENAARNIAFLKETGVGKTRVHLDLPEGAFSFIAAAFYPCPGGAPDFSAPVRAQAGKTAAEAVGIDGEWLFLAFYLRPHNDSHVEIMRKEKLPGGYREILNFLNKPAVDTFIGASLQPLADGIKDFSGLVDAIFTDEPALMSLYCSNTDRTRSFDSVPWGESLFDEYEKRYKAPLTDSLAFLFFGGSEEAKTVRLRYYRLISDLLLRNFTQNVQAWCRGHGVKYSGHFLLEEATYYHVGYYGDFMKVMSALDIPGFDILIADSKKFWKKGNAFGSSWLFAGKYAASVSRIQGHNTTMLEICPYMEKEAFKKDPYGEFMALMTFSTFVGATHINAYSFEALQDHPMRRHWYNYTARLACMLRESVSDCRIAVYYPIADAQAAFTATGLDLRGISPRSYQIDEILENMSMAFYESKLDYNFLTEDAVLKSAVSGGRLVLKGVEYDALVFPSATVVPLAVMRKLQAFTKAGGALFFVDERPVMGVAPEEHGPVREIAGRLCTPERMTPADDFTPLTAALREITAGPLTVTGGGVFVSRYKKDGAPLYHLINTAPGPAPARLEGEGTARLYQPLDGSVTALPLPADITIAGARGVFVGL